MIKHGMWMGASHCKADGLVSVKKFYDILRKNPVLKQLLPKMGIRERLRRCAAQPAYFIIREQKRRAELLGTLAAYFLKHEGSIDIITAQT